jgi:hypothetical protein
VTALDRSVRLAGSWLVAGLPVLAVPGLALLVAASAIPLGIVHTTTGWFNDFHSYWLAGRLLMTGGNPYDLAALAALGRSAGLTFVVGGGYSYPVPFAIALVPLAGLPFDVALVLFEAASALVVALTVGWWLEHHQPAAPAARRLVAGLAVGAYAPVAGSLYMGQANLLLLGLLAPGIGLMDRAPVRAGLAVAGSAVVKLVPGALILPLLLARRWLTLVGLVGGAIVLLGLGGVLAPRASAGSSALAALFEPDPYWTNQSLNGLVSRALIPSDRTAALLSGVDAGPWAAAATVLFGVLVVLLLARRADAIRRDRSTFALAVAVTLAGAVLGAPKDSFWNHALVLPALGLVVASVAPDLDVRRFALTDRVLLGAWFGLAIAQGLVGPITGFTDGPLAGLRTVLGSAGVVSLAALWLVSVRCLEARARSLRQDTI